MKNVITFLFVICAYTSATSQNLNWQLSAQAGTANHEFKNFQGAILAGFKTFEGQQLSVGPVFKGYSMNSAFRNVTGGRIYSQVKVYEGVSMYLQCDVFGGTKSSFVASARSTMRLETGAGIIYTYRDAVGISAGYSLAEYNPLTQVRKNAPSIKLVYLMPFGRRNW